MEPIPLDLTETAQANAASPVDEQAIARVVDLFYDRIRSDPRLGPLFASRITDWDRHLGIMRDFWSASLLRTGRYSGRPVERHRLIEGLSADDFDRWLALFRTTVNECCTPAGADAFMDIAERMAVAMTKMLGLTPRDDGTIRSAPFLPANPSG